MTPKVKRRPWPEVREEERLRFPDVFAAYEAFKQAVRAGQRPSPDRPFIVVEGPNDLPTFASESEEHEFWGTHTVGDAWFDSANAVDHEELPPIRDRSRASR